MLNKFIASFALLPAIVSAETGNTEEKQSNKQCIFAGDAYSHGAKISQFDIDVSCTDGTWGTIVSSCVFAGQKYSNGAIIPLDEERWQHCTSASIWEVKSRN